MKVSRRLDILTKLASLRSRIFFKKKRGLAGNKRYKMMLATDGGKAVEVGSMSIDNKNTVKWSEINPKFRGTGLGRLMYSRVAQAEGKLVGDKVQSGLAHGVYQALSKPRRASSKKPLAMSAEKMKEKGLAPTEYVPTKTTLYQLPGATKWGKNKKTNEMGLVPNPTVPLKIYRPGSKQAKEQAKRMIAAGEDPKNWTTKAQIKRWKNAAGDKEIEEVKARPDFLRAASLERYTSKGLRPGKYESVGGSRKTKPSPIKVENRLRQLYPDNPKKAKEELERIRKDSFYPIGLYNPAAGNLASAERLGELRKSNPKDFGRPYGTIMSVASPETKARHVAKLRSEGKTDDVPLNLYTASFRNKKARDAKHLYTKDRMSPRYRRMMRKRKRGENKGEDSLGLIDRVSIFKGLSRLFGMG